MTFTLLSVTIFSMIALFVYIHAKRGYKNGLNKSLIGLAVLFVSVFLCVLLSGLIALAMENVVVWILESVGVYNDIVGSIGEYYMMAILAIFRMILSIMLYIPVFFILKGILNAVIKLILRKRTGLKYKKNMVNGYLSENEPFYIKHEKKLGAIIGAVAGFLIAIVFLTPLAGTLKTADRIFETVECFPRQDFIVQDDVDLMNKYANDFSVNFVYVCGGALIYDLTTKTNVNGETVSLSDEVDIVCRLDFDSIFNEEFNLSEPTSEDIDRIDGFLDQMNQSHIMKLFSVGAVRQTMLAWESGSSCFGLVKPRVNGYQAVNDFLDKVFYTCSTTDHNYYENDIDTVLNLLRIFLECGEISETADYEDIITKFEENNTIHKMDQEIKKNPHMSTLSTAIDDMIMSILSSEVYELGEVDEDSKNILYAEISEALNSTQGLSGSVKTVALSNYLSQSFENYGVYIPQSLNSKIAQILDDKTSEYNGEITQEQVELLFDEYLS